MPIYRVILVCDGVPVAAGSSAAVDITTAFKSRKWHSYAVCEWDGSCLILTAENDFDAAGLATQDEFSDEIAANIAGGFDGNLTVRSVERLAE